MNVRGWKRFINFKVHLDFLTKIPINIKVDDLLNVAEIHGVKNILDGHKNVWA